MCCITAAGWNLVGSQRAAQIQPGYKNAPLSPQALYGHNLIPCFRLLWGGDG